MRAGQCNETTRWLAKTNHVKKTLIKLSIPYLKSPAEEPREEPLVQAEPSTGKKQ
jgi:hypothetical protein